MLLQPGNRWPAGDAAQGQDKFVEGDFLLRSRAHGLYLDHPARKISPGEFAHLETARPGEGTQAHDRVLRMQAAGAGLHQKRMEDEEIVAVDQQHLGLIRAQPARQALHREGAAEASADNHDPGAILHCPGCH